MTSIVKNVVNWGSNVRARTPPVDLCEVCRKKPKFVDKDGAHPYCSRTCARNAGGSVPVACVLHGCRATGRASFVGFCSEAHAKEGVRLGMIEGCEWCGTHPRTVNTMCVPCDRLMRASGPRVRELNVDGNLFKQIKGQFISEWDAASTHAPVVLEKIYEIVFPRDVKVRCDQYRASIVKPVKLRTFYSSQCICDLGTKEAALCSFQSCGICCIVKSGFKSFAFGEQFNQGRFGEGIYSYRCPTLADRFATSCTTSPYRVMLACDTTVEASQSVRNNHAEAESLFVPVADAILPVYILIYTK